MRARTKILTTAILLLFIYATYFFTQFNKSATQISVDGVSSNLTLIKEPDDGESVILNTINSAEKEIDVEVYMLSDKNFINALKNAKQKGVRVVVLLEKHPYGSASFNNNVFDDLKSAGIIVSWTNPAFSLTHEKAIVVDGKKAFIMNQNLTASSFSKNREYDIVDTNYDDIVEIEKIFFADANRRDFTTKFSNLVISPINSRNMLISLLKSASKEIDIETEVIEDNEVISVLEEKAAQIPIKIILADFSQIPANKKAAEELSAHNIKVETLKSPYIHAKLIMVDGKKAYIGSVNLTAQSMDENRELGIIITQTSIIQELIADFSSDFENAKN